ncbi:MAG: ATP-binding protein, partial [Erysipelotrichaceae bacterium]|nr:ATP-binding protein [Erysipelotrichaceae bacterium]
MNPYNLSFGKKPNQSISRMAQLQPVLEDFRSAQPSQQVYILSGVRGSGKTVAMTELAESIQKEDDWIVVECNPQRDFLMTLVAKLTSLDPVAQIIR